MNVNSVVNHCLSLSFFELQHFAGKNYNVVYDYIKANHKNTNPNSLLVGTIFTCIATNGSLSQKEWEFIMQFIGGYSYNEALETAGSFLNEEARNIVRSLVATFPGNVSEAYLSMCIAILAVDGRVDGEEIEFLKSLY